MSTDWSDVDDARVTAALGRQHPGPEDLAALLSPAATSRLEELAARAAAVTRQRFGRVVRLFAPLYCPATACPRVRTAVSPGSCRCPGGP